MFPLFGSIAAAAAYVEFGGGDCARLSTVAAMMWFGLGKGDIARLAGHRTGSVLVVRLLGSTNSNFGAHNCMLLMSWLMNYWLVLAADHAGRLLLAWVSALFAVGSEVVFPRTTPLSSTINGRRSSAVERNSFGWSNRMLLLDSGRRSSLSRMMGMLLPLLLVPQEDSIHRFLKLAAACSCSWWLYYFLRSNVLWGPI